MITHLGPQLPASRYTRLICRRWGMDRPPPLPPDIPASSVKAYPIHRCNRSNFTIINIPLRQHHYHHHRRSTRLMAPLALLDIPHTINERSVVISIVIFIPYRSPISHLLIIGDNTTSRSKNDVLQHHLVSNTEAVVTMKRTTTETETARTAENTSNRMCYHRPQRM